MVASIVSGIVLVIVPLLTLTTNQMEKNQGGFVGWWFCRSSPHWWGSNRPRKRTDHPLNAQNRIQFNLNDIHLRVSSKTLHHTTLPRGIIHVPSTTNITSCNHWQGTSSLNMAGHSESHCGCSQPSSLLLYFEPGIRILSFLLWRQPRPSIWYHLSVILPLSIGHCPSIKCGQNGMTFNRKIPQSTSRLLITWRGFIQHW